MQHTDSGAKETIELMTPASILLRIFSILIWHAESECVLVVKFLAVVGVRIHLQNSINYNRNNSAAHSQMVNPCYSVVYHTI